MYPFRRGRRTLTPVLAVLAVLALAAAVAAAGPAAAKPKPVLSFSSTSLHFSVPSDPTLTHEARITITNSGQSATSAIKFTLPADSAFAVVGDDCPRSLGPRKSCTVTIAFHVTAALDAAEALTASSPVATALLALIAEVRDDSMPGAAVPPCEPFYISGKCIVGTDGDDYTYGSLLDDQQFGLGGNDDLHGSSGNDWMYGDLDSTGDMTGPEGNDTMHGGIGADRLYGRGGDDVLYGNEGADILWGESGSDQLYGGDGDDVLWDQWKYYPDQPDTFSGGAGDDTCYASRGDIILDCEHVEWMY